MKSALEYSVPGRVSAIRLVSSFNAFSIAVVTLKLTFLTNPPGTFGARPVSLLVVILYR